MNTASEHSAQSSMTATRFERVMALAKACHEDPALLSRTQSEPRDVLAEHGFNLPPEIDARIVFNTRDTFHFILPPDPNAELSDETLSAVAGGKGGGGGGQNYWEGQNICAGCA